MFTLTINKPGQDLSHYVSEVNQLVLQIKSTHKNTTYDGTDIVIYFNEEITPQEEADIISAVNAYVPRNWEDEAEAARLMKIEADDYAAKEAKKTPGLSQGVIDELTKKEK